ncbi:probable protein phosphatase 2C 65 [Malania oleifera]|uniref:probable protein phosphatase 2C 65 n=1 Tax=Malania oleifera TaxID=397392 RepID=UPI0025AE7A82|nr:probable protein phosphatase 2C 65 [Malania oleifera]
MGACCTKDDRFEGFMVGDAFEENCGSDGEEGDVCDGEGGAIVRLRGSSRFTSMFTQQGSKGINQDAMTVWENFAGEKNTFFCGVFDGHGPLGHKVARHVRDNLPLKLFSAYRVSQSNGCNADCEDRSDEHCQNDNENDNIVIFDKIDNDDSENENKDKSSNPLHSSWKANFIKSFKKMDEELSVNSGIDSYCSGSTAVSVLKQGYNLIIGNLGDSRAVLFTRDSTDELIPVQLTVDLKPNIPNEAERIKKCKGRVFALNGEPDVARVWMPDENCPGLAMARAFGDFCLKDYGVISTPKVTCRKLTKKDEFLVLATDGVWDVLTNNEVMRIVASVKKRSVAARVLVDTAVEAWRRKYPNAKVDDCAVICLFFKRPPPPLPKSVPPEDATSSVNPPGLAASRSGKTAGRGIEKVAGGQGKKWTALDGASRANSIVNLPRYGSASTVARRKLAKEFEDVEIHC